MSKPNPANIFETLRGNESSDDETMQVVKQRDPTQKRIRPKKNKGDVAGPSTSTNVQEPVDQSKEDVKRVKHAKDGKPDRKVSSDPHPKDKQSGTGRGREMRKGGQGKSNWGTYKDDLRDEEQVGENNQQPEEEEVDDSVTLSELMKQRQQRSLQASKQELVIKNEKELDLTTFKKEKCELISRKVEIDDRKIGGKKTTVARTNYNIINTNQENELLGLRTGLKVYSEKPRVEVPVQKADEKAEEKVQEKPQEKEERPRRKFSGKAERKESGEGRRGRGGRYQKEGY